MPQIHDAVITGVGVVSPIGIGKDAFWNSVLEGTSGIRRLDGAMGQVSTRGFGGNLVDFDPKAHVRPRKALKVMCREIQTAFAAASLAFVDAKLEPDSVPSDSIGTVFGSEMMSGEPEEVVDTMLDCGVASGQPRESDFGESAMRKIYPLWMLKYLPNMATCHVGIMLGALGPNNTVLLGDTSASAAVEEAISVMQRGLADVMITGAAGTRISPTRSIFTSGLDFGSLHQPVGASSRPMAKDRDGVIGGEAAAVIVMETRDVAKRRGAQPIAVVCGSASRFVPSPIVARRATGEIDSAIRLSIEGALRAANVSAKDVGAVVSHAMGHPQIDLSEARTIEAILGSEVPVYAPIAAVGHTGAAAGAIGMVSAALMLEHGMVPPTVNAAERDPSCNVNLLTSPARLEKLYVLLLSHTAQGGAVAIVLKACA
jgi:3-oxoacyl-[acyl-carrier-protein] synthase II